jgi:hypothetical protein
MFPRSRLSLAIGVGYLRTNPASPFRGFIASKFPRFWASFARGVGYRKNPESLAFVIRNRIASSPCGIFAAEHSPFRIVPQRGQVSENSMKPPRSDRWRVLHKRETGSYLANDPVHLRPQSGSFAVDACPVSVDANVLARESSGDDIDNSSPRSAVKRPHVVPDWKSWQPSVSLPLQQCSSAVLINLDRTSWSMSEKHSAENSSPASRK